MTTLHIEIKGKLPRKSNSRKIVYVHGKPKIVKSDEALKYVEDFCRQVPGTQQLNLGSKDRPLTLETDIYYPWKYLGDLSIELLMDCLQISNLIKDDRYIVHFEARKRFSKKNPRVVAEITELSIKALDWW